MTGGILVELKWMGSYLSQSFWAETFWHCVKYRKQNICIQVQVLVVTNVGKIEAIIGRRTLVATTQR